MRGKDKYTGRVEESIKRRAEAEQARERAGKVIRELRELYEHADILQDEAQLLIREGKTLTSKAIIG